MPPPLPPTPQAPPPLLSPQPMTQQDDAVLKGTPEKAALMKKLRTGLPQPTLADVEEFYVRMRPQFQLLYNLIIANRQVRYLQDALPAKYARRLKSGLHFRSRLSHNEVLRIAAMMSRNAPKVKIPAIGSEEDAEDRAEKQSRWCQNLFPTLERDGFRPIVRRWYDMVAGDGLGALEVFMRENEVYDNLGGPQADENESDYLERTEKDLQEAGIPFGIRPVGPLAMMFEEDEDGKGISRMLITELKPYRVVFNALKQKGNYDVEQEFPLPGTPGWPNESALAAGRQWMLSAGGGEDNNPTWGWADVSSSTNAVLTHRYYDREWYVYIVGGKVVDCERHGLPGVPVFPCMAITTGSENLHEMTQGVTWGMTEQEKALNLIMTLAIDNVYATGRPKPMVLMPAGNDPKAFMDPATNKPLTVSLSDDEMPYMPPGATIVDANEHLRPGMANDIAQAVLKLFQLNGLNPIASGESPGADAAGYTVNTLSQAAQSQYEILLDNTARVLGNVYDFVRQMVKTTIQERVYLTVATSMQQEKGAEWLALGPEDVDNTPAIVTIDPLSDANRIALRQSLMEGNQQGYVTRERVQRDGYGIDNPEEEDDQLMLESLEKQYLGQIGQVIQAQVYGMMPQPAALQPGNPAQGGGAPGQAGVAGGVSTTPGTPAPLNPPTTGAQQSQASNVSDLPASTALAGQGHGMSMTGGGPR